MNMLKFWKMLLWDFFTLYGSGGGGAAPSNTTSSVTTSTIPDYMKPYAQAMMGSTMSQIFDTTTDKKGNVTINGIKPYVPFTSQDPAAVQKQLDQASQSVAAFNPMQNQAFGGISNLQVPGQTGIAASWTQGSLANAGNLANKSAQGMWDTGAQSGATGQQYAGSLMGAGANAAAVGNQALGYGAQGNQMGQQGFQQGIAYGQNATNPGAVQAYMNPYIQNALNPGLQLLGQQTGIQTAGEQAAATSSGAFGGTREALANALQKQSGDLAANTMIGQGYSNAYNTAQQNMQNASQLGIQGANSGIAGANSGIAGVGTALQGQGLNIQAQNQAGNMALAGLGQQMQGYNQFGQMGLAGVNTQLQGANQLANIGNLGLQQQQNIYNQQLQAGGVQQQQQQNIINQAMQNYGTVQQWPYQQLGFMSDMLHGLPTQNTTTQNYMAAPNPMSQVAGLGIAGLGMYNAATSDIRTKQDIEVVGKLDNGLFLYEFNYKPEFDIPGRFRGVMAHEVEQIMPEAVIVNPAGYKAVIYAFLGLSMERVQ